MKDKRKFLFFCMIFVANCAFSQSSTLQPTAFRSFRPSLLFTGTNYFRQDFKKSVVSAKFYTKNIGFFCRQEMKLEAVTKIPLKFRLGSVQYCDWIEGKKGSSYSEVLR